MKAGEKIRERVAWPVPGRYVVAISGGGDSAALLDLLATHSHTDQWQLVPAHFHHGWEGDDEYERTARQAVDRYDGLKLVVGHGQAGRSEAAAREARYTWLRTVAVEHGAQAIITAHHRDDLEETVLLNLLRGTGRQGLTPFAHMADVLRPLTAVRKAELAAYAADRRLAWCHDTYNDDLNYRRSAVRHQLIPQLERAIPNFHEELASMLDEAAGLNRRIDAGLAKLFAAGDREATAQLATMRRLDFGILTELLVAMAGVVYPGVALDRRTIRTLAADIKTGRLRRRRELTSGLFAEPARDTVRIVFTP